ncbi:hypothetical protein MNBD_ALPHA12-707 [hydrothermal vent metagenome]|uniref:TIGR02300 family protein n=1 Tax=hydrothermal vent metagenome TaxID=652676 RepID=A0A3B0U4I8_9ZZZZ
MASFDRGTKRQCLHCAMKYYDLNRDPILCPGCGKPYQPPEDPVASKSEDKADVAKPDHDNVETVAPDPAAAAAGAKVVSFEDAETDTNATETEGEDIPDVEDVEDIGGEVDNSFVEDDDDDIEFNVVTPKADE